MKQTSRRSFAKHRKQLGVLHSRRTLREAAEAAADSAVAEIPIRNKKKDSDQSPIV
jgi:hypothetical protein